jgi:hypothetical protein
MPQWPVNFSDQVKETLDMTALPIDQYDSVLDEWSKKEYPEGCQTRALSDLLEMANFRVRKQHNLNEPLLSQRQGV